MSENSKQQALAETIARIISAVTGIPYIQLTQLVMIAMILMDCSGKRELTEPAPAKAPATPAERYLAPPAGEGRIDVPVPQWEAERG